MSNENINLNEERSLSQKKTVLQLLQQGAVLTPLDALFGVGTKKLATRISELISDGHTEIHKARVQTTTSNGKQVWVMSYFIPKEERTQTTTED